MAAMDSQLVRIHRDIDRWDAADRHTEQTIKTLMRSILALDEQIASANENADQDGGLLPSVPSDAQIETARARKEALFNRLAAANQTLRRLRFIPRRPLDLQEYLEACHSIDLAMPARDILPTLYEVSTHEDIERKMYPRHVVPATDFATEQMHIWQRLAWRPEFRTGALFTNLKELEWIRARVDYNIVGCSGSLFAFIQNTVDEAVHDILNQIAGNGLLVQTLEIEAFVRIIDGNTIVDISRSPLDQGMSSIFTYRRVGNGILRQPVPVLVTCYRPPTRLSLNEILLGLRGSINVTDEIIWSLAVEAIYDMSKILVVAVITQLYNHMLVVGTRFGYITTGEAYIFVEISANNVDWVSYSVCVPRYDVESDPVTGLHRTAVAQVLAFTLRAMRAERMPAVWYHTAQRTVWKWRMNPDDIFNRMPPLLRKAKRDIEYVPESWTPFLGESPLRQRAQRMLWPGFKPRINEATFNDLGYFAFFSSHRIEPVEEPMDQDEDSVEPAEESVDQTGEPVEPAEERIEHRPFCTPECLSGLERLRNLDPDCPNFRYHGYGHLSLQHFLDGLQKQLDDDVASENHANYRFLRRSGPYTVLLKVRLASHGYTLLLKGVIPSKVNHLLREANIYDELVSVQGFHVPVSFGMIRTQREVSNHTFGAFTDFMVFGGFPEGLMPLFQCVAAGMDKQTIVNAVERAFEQIHRERVLHFDPEPRNLLYDARANMVIVADFERAVYDVLEGQQYLSPIAQIEGVHEGVPEKIMIPDDTFLWERVYVRERVEEFFDRGY